MPALVSRGFPLFPLGIVALPTERIPLHIFEDRYRRMIERCLAAAPGSLEREFGILWLSDDELKDVGCACEIDAVLDRMDDGRLNILARGTRPFRLIERQDELPYPAGVVEFLSDHDARDGGAGEPVEGTSAEPGTPGEAGTPLQPGTPADARALYRELVEIATDRELSDDELSLMDAYAMAATVEFGTDAKQELLELRSEPARLRLLATLLRTAIERLAVIDRAQARARSNGKVRFG
jgi:ATP-dependent protease La (LON) substrate-binding domain